jgi:hypothetical protein
MHRETLVRFVQEECGGKVKEAAERTGLSVSHILAIAPELKTPQQLAFDVKKRR